MYKIILILFFTLSCIKTQSQVEADKVENVKTCGILTLLLQNATQIKLEAYRSFEAYNKAVSDKLSRELTFTVLCPQLIKKKNEGDIIISTGDSK